MTQDEAKGTQSQDMDCDHPYDAFINVEFVEKVDDNPRQNIENHTVVDSNVLDAKKRKMQKKRKRQKASKRRKRELLRNSSSLKDSTSHSTLPMQEISTKDSSLDPESHAQIDINQEAKEVKSLKRKRRGRKKREMSSDSSLPLTENIQGTSTTGSPLEDSNPAPVCAYTEEMMKEKVHEPSLLIKENDMYPAGEEHINTELSEKGVEEDGILCGALLEDVSEKFSVQFSKDKLDAGNDTLNSSTKEVKSAKKRKRGRKNRKISSNSSLPLTEDIQATSAKASLLEDSNPTPVSAYTEELMEEEVSIHEPSLLIKEKEISEKGVEEHDILSDASLKDVSNTGNGILNIEPRPHDDITISAELSETTDGDDVSRPDIGKEQYQLAPLAVRPGESRKKLLVLDVNGILTDIVNYVSGEYTPDTIISRKAVFKRPYYDDFLRFCFEKFHVGVWSSRTMRNVKSAIDFLMGELQSKLLFCWDQSHCTDTGFYTIENREKPMLLKELKKIWEKHEPSLPWERGDYNESNTLLLDDSPYKALRNPPFTAIFPKPYSYKDVSDNSLGPGGDLRVYLEGLATADDVQKYVKANPFGQRAITSTNASWNFYRKVIHDTSLPARKRYNCQSASKSALPQRYK